MTRHRFALVFLAVLSLLTSRLSAAEPYLEFVEGLREREYYDTAMDYLEWAETRPDLPPEVKEIIPFEKATTLIQLSKVQRNPETANATLSRAQAFLEQFLKASPNHPKAAKANSDAANVLVGKGKVAVMQAKSPANANKRAEFQKQAKESFEQARKLFQDSALKYDKEWQGYGAFVDEAKEPEKHAAKELAERMKIRAELDVAIVQYEESQAYEKDDPKYQSGLKEASEKFELIHQKHRSQVAGLYARMYQAKCFEEQGDLKKALGLYKELLDHHAESATMKNLQAQVTHFKMICLNSGERADYTLADAEAQKWIKENPNMVRTRYGTGIRFEQARALEMRAKARDLKPDEKNKLLAEALGAARIVNRTGGEFRDPSQAMITRLMAALNRDGSEPKDFDTAYGMARELVNRIKEVKDAIKGGKDAEETKNLQRAFELHLDESARLLNLALSLRKSDTKIKEINLCRYSLCYVYYEQRRSYDSAVLGEFVARRYADYKDDKEEDMGSTPADAAYLAMAAYAQAYNAKGNKDKATDIAKIVSISDFIVTKWSGTPKAIDALVMLGQMYIAIKDFVKAAETLEKVPADSGPYLKVQLMLGQALWEATIEGLNKPEAERPPAEVLNGYQTKAQDVLKKAIATLEPKLAPNELLPDELASAKLTLAQMANQTTQYAEAIKLLETDPRAVLTVVAVPEGTPRPATGVKSGKFAQEVYKQILRAYIGLQNLENARKAMTDLEKIAAGQGQDILPIYIALGKQFKEELDRLSKANPDQHKTVLKSFESFLKNMLDKKDGQNYNSLAWIGAMYVSLGEGTADKAQAATYFAEGSTAYTELITKAEADPAFCTDQQKLAGKAQLVACKRKAGDFATAVDMIKELLKLRPNAIDTQTEACFVFQDWASSGQTDSPKQWDVAMRGDAALPAKIGMWGWTALSKKLLKSADAAKFTEQFLESRYNIAYCLYHSSADLQGAKKLSGLGEGATQIERTAQQMNLDDTQYAKFNGLYRDIETAMGKSPKDLARSAPDPAELKTAQAEAQAEAEAEKKAESKKAKSNKGKKKNPVVAKNTKSSSSSTMLIVGLLVVVAAGGGAWFVLRGKKVHSLAAVGASDEFPDEFVVSAPAPAKKAAPASVSGAAGATKAKSAPKPPSKPKA